MARPKRQVDASQILFDIHERWETGGVNTPRQARQVLPQIEQAIAELENGGPVDEEILVWVCRYHTVAMQISYEHSLWDSAWHHIKLGNEVFERARDVEETFLQYLHLTSVTMWNMGIREPAIEVAERAVDYATRNLPHLLPTLMETAVDMKMSVGATVGPSRAELELLLLNAQNAPVGKRVATSTAIVEPLRQHGELLNQSKLCLRLLRMGFAEGFAAGRLNDQIAVLSTGFAFYRDGVHLPRWFANACRSTMLQAERDDRADVASICCALQAAHQLQKGRPARALPLSLRALVLQELQLIGTGSSEARFYSSQDTSWARSIALDVTLSLDNPMLTAEIVESLRLQARAAQAVDESGGLERPRSISVGGRSHLQPYRSATEVAIALEDTIAVVGGQSADWWAAVVMHGRYYWASRTAGRWFSGAIDFKDNSRLEELYAEALTACPDASQFSSTISQAIRGPWCRSRRSEEEMSVELGDLLIPESLKGHLLEAHRSPHPLSLVVSGPLFSFFPIILLGFSTALGPVRIVECAITRHAPPSVVVADMGKASGRVPYLPIVCCVNPTNDLNFSGALPDGYVLALRGEPTSGEIRATRENLLLALRSMASRAANGLFYYSGHVVSLNLAGDDQDGLVLADQVILTARDLRQLDESIIPARVLLSACQSAGAAGSGAGEWLGLGAAMIESGAECVVATNWPILDTPFTAAFDHKLVRLLEQGADAAAALHAAQLDAYRDWRRSDHDFDLQKEDGLRWEDRMLALPIIWGAYCALGVVQEHQGELHERSSDC